MFRNLSLALAVFAGLALFAGCGSQDSATKVDKAAVQPKVDEHSHKPGAHGGIIVPVGRDNYHAEAVFEKGGTFRLFILSKDETRPQDVEKQPLQAFARPEAGGDSVSFSLGPVPQHGDAAGMTSQFVGKLPPDLLGQSIVVSIPSIRIAGERFRVPDMKSPEQVHARPGDDAERKLYLTPGGKYTMDDIQANGNTSPWVKFKGIDSAHDVKTKPGDIICPISETKSNPKFTWVVGGQKYEFCCPPCIDEFVKQAKEQPESIKEPKEYVKK